MLGELTWEYIKEGDKMNNVANYTQYHFHTDYSNITTQDSGTKFEEYVKKAKEYGMTTITSCEHGTVGDLHMKYDICKSYGLKLVTACEFYLVENRFKKENRENFHIIVIAKKKDGYRHINRLISESWHESSYYYRPRIDIELLQSLNHDDFIVTTSCIAGIINNPDIFNAVYKHFGKNLYIEMQPHNHERQKKFNGLGLKVANKLGLKIISANDSHYVDYNDDKVLRDIILANKRIRYDNEDEFVLDFPNIETLRQRYSKQGILSKEQIEEAIANTNDIANFEGVEFDKNSIKMPSLFPNLTHKEKMVKLKEIVNREFKKKLDNNEIDKSRVKEYVDAVLYEIDIVEKTKMEDYFLLNYYICKNAIEKYDGVLTNTGRGSGAGFILWYFLGVSHIDRLYEKVTLYPTRFMSYSRIVEEKSLPDYDFNTANPEPFAKASKEFLGEHNVYAMISFKTYGLRSSIRAVARYFNFPLEDVDVMSDKFDTTDKEVIQNVIDKYSKDEKWKKIFELALKLKGVIESFSLHSCSYMLYSDNDIREQFGVIKTKHGDMVCMIDSDLANDYHYLKNDFLTVTVVDIIDRVCKKVGISIPTAKELDNLIDDKVWKLYEDGIVATLNQVGSDFAVDLIKTYNPKNIEEMSAFVASIRPGFESDRNKFLNREKFSYGIPEFDNLLTDSGGYLMYQESIMKALIYAGFPEDETYGIVKAISKKKLDKIMLAKDKFMKGFIDKTGSEENALKVWKVIEDNSNYSFNLSHSICVARDSVMQAFLKANYPIEYYSVVLEIYSDNRDKQKEIISELHYFNITLENPQFNSNVGNEYSYDKTTNIIYRGLKSYKYINEKVADEVNSLYNKNITDITSFYIETLENTTLTKTHIETLIKLNFFEPLCKYNAKMLKFYDIFREGFGTYTIKATEQDIISTYEKLFGKTQDKKFLNSVVKAILTNGVKYSKGLKSTELRKTALQIVWELMPNEKFTLSEQLSYLYELSGELSYTNPKASSSLALVVDISGKHKNKRVQLYRLKDGSQDIVHIHENLLNALEIKSFDIIETLEVEKQQVEVLQKQENGENKWVEIEGKFRNQLVKFNKIIWEN